MKKLAVVTFAFLGALFFIQGASANTRTSSNANTNISTDNAPDSKTKTKIKAKSPYKTNFNFDDLLVSGKYHYPDEATATVEDEKLLSDLLDFRKEFKDRLSQSSSRH